MFSAEDETKRMLIQCKLYRNFSSFKEFVYFNYLKKITLKFINKHQQCKMKYTELIGHSLMYVFTPKSECKVPTFIKIMRYYYLRLAQ